MGAIDEWGFNKTTASNTKLAKFFIIKSWGGRGAGVFESIRAGAEWETFVNNIERIRSLAKLSLFVTIQRDNIFTLGDVIDFAIDNRLNLSLTNILINPDELSISRLPVREKRRAIEYVCALVSDYQSKLGLETLDELKRVVGFLESSG